MTEWMPIETAPKDGGWEVSADGSVRNHKGVVRQHRSSKGYPKVCLAGKTVFVHRLVADAFVHKPEWAYEVNHLNGDKADNRAENLEWTTRSDNMRHAYKAGLHSGVALCGEASPHWGRKGALHPQSMPVRATFPDGTHKDYESQGLAAADGFRPHKISRCINGHNKKHGGATWLPLPEPPETKP